LATSRPHGPAPDLSAAQAYGKAWLEPRRTLILLVPSVVTRGLDWNAVINPAHADVPGIQVTVETRAVWNDRLTITVPHP
jgi:RES domain-containing protein